MVEGLAGEEAALDLIVGCSVTVVRGRSDASKRFRDGSRSSEMSSFEVG